MKQLYTSADIMELERQYIELKKRYPHLIWQTFANWLIDREHGWTEDNLPSN